MPTTTPTTMPTRLTPTLVEFWASLFAGAADPARFPAPPVCPSIWSACPLPSTAPESITSLWAQLDNSARLAECAAWTRVAFAEPLHATIAASIARFQVFETFLQTDDHFPLPWSEHSYQAAVAAYWLVWLARQVAAKDGDGRLEPVRSQLDVWFQTAAKATDMLAGDHVVMFRCRAGLAAWRRFFAGHLADLEARRRNLDAEIADVLSVVNPIEWLLGWFGRRRRLADLRIEERAIASEIERYQRAASELDQGLSRWRDVSLLCMGDADELSGAAAATSPAPRDAARLSALFESSGARGLVQWLVRRLSDQAPDPSAGAAAVSAGVLRFVSAFPVAPRPGVEAGWRTWISVLRFFDAWAARVVVKPGALPLANTSPNLRRHYDQLFGAWDAVMHGARELDEYGSFMADDARQQFLAEFRECSANLDDKLADMRRLFLNVMSIPVTIQST